MRQVRNAVMRTLSIRRMRQITRQTDSEFCWDVIPTMRGVVLTNDYFQAICSQTSGYFLECLPRQSTIQVQLSFMDGEGTGFSEHVSSFLREIPLAEFTGQVFEELLECCKRHFYCYV